MFKKLKEWYRGYSSDVFKINVDELISGFDKKTQKTLKENMQRNDVDFSIFNKDRFLSASYLGFILCEVYRHAADYTNSGAEGLTILNEDDYNKLPKKDRGLYQYNKKTGNYWPRGNAGARECLESEKFVLKYRKGADKGQVQQLVGSLYQLYRDGCERRDLKELYDALSLLSKSTMVENIADKKRDAQNSGSAQLAKEKLQEKEKENWYLRGNEELVSAKEYGERKINDWLEGEPERSQELLANQRKEIEKMKERHRKELQELQTKQLGERRKVEGVPRRKEELNLKNQKKILGKYNRTAKSFTRVGR